MEDDPVKASDAILLIFLIVMFYGAWSGTVSGSGAQYFFVMWTIPMLCHEHMQDMLYRVFIERRYW